MRLARKYRLQALYLLAGDEPDTHASVPYNKQASEVHQPYSVKMLVCSKTNHPW